MGFVKFLSGLICWAFGAVVMVALGSAMIMKYYIEHRSADPIDIIVVGLAHYDAG